MGRIKKLVATFITLTLVISIFGNLSVIKATDDSYEIYPTPQDISYQNGDFILKDNINVVFEDGIDEATKARLQEVVALKDLSTNVTDEVDNNTTNIMVGIYGSNGYVDNYVSSNSSLDNSLFDRGDSYYLHVNNDKIVVLGKDSDSAFYGLTTLYMVVAQLESRTIKNFTVLDYSDVASRGFIEGYYGNPWSTQDRINLMTWGGYYKLNSYFYAPKDDPKHNSKWRELYTEEEIETKIKPLAKAGNDSKCRFVFALHPFMNNPISFTQSNYESDLAALQAKFEQVIVAGVRQIAILADDAANYNNSGDLGGNNYQRLLEDMTAWLKQMQETYPDLKLTLPFCPVEYMGNGQDYYANFPDNVQIVMTGGRVWGEVSNNFTSTFTNNVGRGPYMWINWPCTDNSKQHLIMGGYETFLQAGVDPEKIQGIVLNPMQQSEPSKVAIFGNACYSWNIWETNEQANQAWEDSFKYVDHNSPLETEASNALKELSKHMINQNMDSRVTALNESVELAVKLDAFKEKLDQGTVSEADVDDMIGEFEILKEATNTYRQFAGNSDTLNQMVYWLDCFDDTTSAAIAYLNGVKAVLNNDTNGILQYNNEGKVAFDNSKTHGFHYVDHIEYAEVGVQHIVPFINALATYVGTYSQTLMNPDMVIKTFITNRSDKPVGEVDNVFDGDDSTMVSYRNPVWIYTGDYVGVKYNKVIAINDIRFLLGNGKNHFEACKLQYTIDGSNWQDLTLTGMDNQFTGVRNEYLNIVVSKENLPANFEAMGIRLIATEDNTLDAYLNVHEIQINSQTSDDEITGEYTTNRDLMNSTSLSVLNDGNNGNSSDSEVWLSVKSGNDKDKLPDGSYLAYTFNTKVKIGTVYFSQGGSAGGDVITDGSLQYLDDNGNWITVGNITNDKVQEFDLTDNNIETTAVRIYNNSYANIWWRVGEFRVVIVDDSNVKPIEYNVIKTDRWQVYSGSESNLYDGNDETFVWYDPDGSANTTGDDFMVDDYLGYDFGKVATLTNVHVVVGAGDGDKIVKYAIETSIDGTSWSPITGYESYEGTASGKDVIDITLDNLNARYIRLRNLQQQGSWGKFSEFTVKELLNQEGTKDYLYTNVNSDLLSNLADGKASLTSGTVTLKTNDYIGIDLKNIKHINTIDVTSLENCTLEVSKNQIEWIESNGDIDGRYVRIINHGNDEVTVNLSKFEVDFDYIAEKSVTSDFANQQTSNDMRTGGNVNNVFDGDLSTLGMINGPQEKGKQIIFDLGQTIHFESIRYYVVETQLNYLRDADFEVSKDGQTWTKVLHVGKEVENVWDSTVAKDMQDITLLHDNSNPGYMYGEATGLDVDGRYIRVTPTSTYSHRWVAFNEIQINGGAYISTEANRDIVSEDVEEEGKIPSNMIDKDFSTSYKSSATNSSFTYYVSNPEGIRTIRIVQSGSVSNATVVAEVYRNGQNETLELGTLNQTISEFVLPEDAMIKDIKVSWETTIPEILEITLSTQVEDAMSAKNDLKAKLDQNVDTSNWTISSKQKYQNAYEVASDVYNNQYASKFAVESAIGLLNSAINSGEEKYTDSQLNELVAEAILNDQGYYTTVSYNAYNLAITKAKMALENPDDLSVTDGNKLVAAIQKAQDNLVYSILYREQAQLLVNEELQLSQDIYSSESIQAYQEAKTALIEAIDLDKQATTNQERVLPATFATLIENYNQAKANLQISAKATLQALIDEFDSYNSELYEPASYAAYKQAVNDAKTAIESATLKETIKHIDTIRKAKEALVIDTSELQTVIDDAKALDSSNYTEKSYQDLMDLVAKAQETNDKAYIELINEAKNNLVNVVALKATINEIENIDATKYTKASYQLVTTTLNEAKELLVAGNQESVDKMQATLIEAVNGLVLSGQSDYEAYLAAIELKDAALYTKESYETYLMAYQQLKALGDDVSMIDFNQAKVVFEEAIQALEYLKADYSKVEAILATIPEDLSAFNQDAVNKLKQIIDSINYDLTINDQEIVDDYATKLQAALDEVLQSMNETIVTPETGNSSTITKPGNSTSAATGDNVNLIAPISLMFIMLLLVVSLKKKKLSK